MHLARGPGSVVLALLSRSKVVAIPPRGVPSLELGLAVGCLILERSQSRPHDFASGLVSARLDTGGAKRPCVPA